MNPIQASLIGLLRLYRWAVSPLISAVFGPLSGCRFTPTCSVYAIEAIKIHGAVKGTWLATLRLGRCHPWGPAGADPVPPRKSNVPRSASKTRDKSAHSPSAIIDLPDGRSVPATLREAVSPAGAYAPLPTSA